MLVRIPPHGTYARYRSKRAPCKCRDCGQANNAYMRAYMAAHPEQRQKKRERNLTLTSGEKRVANTRPGQWLYWPGLFEIVDPAFRLKVRAAVLEATERAVSTRDNV